MDVIESGIGELFQKPDPYGFREYVHQHKSQAMKDKLMTEQEAVSRFVSDGDYLGTELYGTVRGPMSLAREVIRQGKKHLRLAGLAFTRSTCCWRRTWSIRSTLPMSRGRSTASPRFCAERWNPGA